MKRILAGALVILPLCGAPAIKPNGIVNAASYRPAGIPGSAVARGSLATAFGAGLGPATGVEARSFPLQATLAGVSIRLTQGTTSVSGIPLFVFAGQVNFIVPSNTPLGAVQATITFNNETSPPVIVQVVATSLGLFTLGGGVAVAQNFVPGPERPLNTLANSARPGQVVIAYATGLGAITAPDNQPPPVGEVNGPVEILVGGRPANKLYAGRSPCCAGLDEIDFELAPDTPTGCYVPVVVRAGEFYSNVATIAVARDGGACSDPQNLFSSLLSGRGTPWLGAIELTRIAIRITLFGLNIDSTLDSASASFFRADERFYSGFLSLPPMNSCSVYSLSFDFDDLDLTPFSIAAELLDAGPNLVLSGPNGSRTVSQDRFGTYQADLGGGLALPGAPPPPPLYLSPGSYTIRGFAGSDVGSFSAELNLPTALTWRNRDEITEVIRSRPLTLTWAGGNPSRELALVAGFSADSELASLGAFVCVASISAGTFTVPTWVLASLPASGSESGVPIGMLMLINSSVANATTFTAPRLDLGLFYYNLVTARLLAFR